MNNHNEIFCFFGDTQVLTNYGEQRIDTIRRGDVVISYNHETCDIEEVVVDTTARSSHSCFAVITLEDGRQVKSTTDHPYWVIGKGWSSCDPDSSTNNYGVNSDKLEVDDGCISYSNKEMTNIKIASIEIVYRECLMYVISGGSNNTFFANGIMVHDENIRTNRLHYGHQGIQAHNKANSLGQPKAAPLVPRYSAFGCR